MSAILDRVLAGIDGRRDNDINLLRALVGAQREGEAAVQAIVADRLAALGASVERIVYAPADVALVGEFAAEQAIAVGERASVVGSLAGRGDGKSLMLFAHPDSEPVSAAHGWRHDPFAGVVAEGRMYGWGIADDLLGVAAGVAAMAAISQGGRATGGAGDDGQYAQQTTCAGRGGDDAARYRCRCGDLSPSGRIRSGPARDQGVRVRPA
jgi:acetylornithine deacetylase